MDKEVQVDGNLVNSRNPNDIPAFTGALIKSIEQMADLYANRAVRVSKEYYLDYPA